MSLQVTPKSLLALFATAICVLLLGGWFVLVAGQRSQAASLESKTADAQSQLAAAEAAEKEAVAQAAAAKAHAKSKKNKGASKQESETAVLARAFPSSTEMPSILLQVERLARDAGVSLESFAPAGATPQSGYSTIPIDVSVTGRYREIQRFVHDLRVQAGSSKGRIHASGRLFSVETVGITAAAEGLPSLSATIQLTAFVYSGIVPPAETTEDGSDPTASAEGTP